jgi:hypothetical protein
MPMVKRRSQVQVPELSTVRLLFMGRGKETLMPIYKVLQLSR